MRLMSVVIVIESLRHIKNFYDVKYDCVTLLYVLHFSTTNPFAPLSIFNTVLLSRVQEVTRRAKNRQNVIAHEDDKANEREQTYARTDQQHQLTRQIS